jgi:membrane-associated phospholipid phosphatase
MFMDMEDFSVEGDAVTAEPALAVGRRKGWSRRFLPLDAMVLAYTAWVAVLVAVSGESLSETSSLLAFHAFVLAAILLIPPRGASWERAPAGERALWRHARGGLRFFRYSYPLLLVLFFFEEVQHTVNLLWPGAPHWFENRLYATDRFLLGELPSVALNPFVGLLQNEIVHGFYLSYYFILVGGIVLAWLGSPKTESSPRRFPGPAFQTTLTAAIAAFFLCFVWYPFLPARGPWENPELMAGMTPFRGVFFVPLIEKIIERGAVSGGCFPSSHVAGSWGIVLGLSFFHRRKALLLGFFALGLSFACVYTRYHHGVDVPAGFLAGLTGALIARWVTPRSEAT